MRWWRLTCLHPPLPTTAAPAIPVSYHLRRPPTSPPQRLYHAHTDLATRSLPSVRTPPPLPIYPSTYPPPLVYLPAAAAITHHRRLPPMLPPQRLHPAYNWPGHLPSCRRQTPTTVAALMSAYPTPLDNLPTAAAAH